MVEYFGSLMQYDGFMLHSMCMMASPFTVMMHSVAGILIGLAYFLIPLFFVWIRSRVELPNLVERNRVLFGMFILCCGAGHFLDVYTLLVHPIYRLEGVWMVVTALVSLASAAVLVFNRLELLDIVQGASVFIKAAKEQKIGT